MQVSFSWSKKEGVGAGSARREDKFMLKSHSRGILALVEIIPGITHDYLVLEDDGAAAGYNVALFVYVCKLLSFHGYGPNGKISMIPDQKTLSISIDKDYLQLQIENNSVIFTKGITSHYAIHIREILTAFHVKQYQRLP